MKSPTRAPSRLDDINDKVELRVRIADKAALRANRQPRRA